MYTLAVHCGLASVAVNAASSSCTSSRRLSQLVALVFSQARGELPSIRLVVQYLRNTIVHASRHKCFRPRRCLANHPAFRGPTKQLGVCTADSSLRLTSFEHAEKFFTNPAKHCVGYGRLTSENSLGEERQRGIDASSNVPVAEKYIQHPETALGRATASEVRKVTAAGAAPELAPFFQLLRKKAVGSGAADDLNTRESEEHSTSLEHPPYCPDILVSDCTIGVRKILNPPSFSVPGGLSYCNCGDAATSLQLLGSTLLGCLPCFS